MPGTEKHNAVSDGTHCDSIQLLTQAVARPGLQSPSPPGSFKISGGVLWLIFLEVVDDDHAR